MLLSPQTCEDFKSLLHSVFTYLPLLPKPNFSSYILDTIILVNEDDTLAVIQASLLFPCAVSSSTWIIFYLKKIPSGFHSTRVFISLTLQRCFCWMRTSGLLKTVPAVPDRVLSHAVGLRSCLSIYYSCFSCWLWFSALFSRSVVSDSSQPHGLQHTRPPCPSLSPWVCSNSCPLSWWGHPTSSSSVVPFSSCPQSSPASESFPMSPLSTSGGQSIGAAALASVPPMNIQGWFLLGWTGWASLLSKGLSRVFPSTTIWNQFFGAQLFLWSNSHIHTGLLEKP